MNKTPEFYRELISRLLFPTLQQRIGENKVLVLIGARRVGKTVLLHQIRDSYAGNQLELNGDDLTTIELLSDRRVAAYRRWLGNARLLLIDEAQNVPEIGKALKLLIDSFPELTFLATGSAAFDLSNKTGEPLVGRQHTFHLYPIAQLELNPTENYLQTKQELETRLLFGSYPDIIQMSSTKDRISYLKSMVSSYLLKDILVYEQVRHSLKMLQLLQLIAYQIGQEVSYDELSKQLQLDRNTITRYLDLFTKVFILFRLGGYSRNLRKEVTKSAKWYFYDNGLRNALINNFSPIVIRQDIGQLWENYLISERIKRNAYLGSQATLYFWRTYDRQELDLIEEENGQLRAFAMKWTTSRIRLPQAFQNAYLDATIDVINRDNYLDFIES